MSTSETLKGIEARLGLTHDEAARYLGVSIHTYKKWVTGQREPGASTHRLLEVLWMIERGVPNLHDRFIRSAKD